MRFEVENGCFSYDKLKKNKKRVLSDISFSVENNEILAVLGPNGVGKTTMLKCMMGLQKWDSGRTLLDGEDMYTMSHKRVWNRIAYVPQSKSMALSYTAIEMVLMGRSSHLGIFAQPTSEDMSIAEKAMEEVGITFLRDKLCSQMSGGELQMVLIARALCTHPEMLILDEPESNLDFKNQLMILDVIQRLSRRSGLSAIINTHYPAHALKIADKALILDRSGRSYYGKAKDTITEENMKTSFSVEVKIADYEYEDMHYLNVIPIRACGSSPDSSFMN